MRFYLFLPSLYNFVPVQNSRFRLQSDERSLLLLLSYAYFLENNQMNVHLMKWMLFSMLEKLELPHFV